MNKIRIYLSFFLFPLLISCGGGGTTSTDTSSPVITLKGSNTVSYHRLSEEEFYIIPELELGAEAIDNEGNALSVDIMNVVIYDRLGVYKTVYTAVDDVGRSSSKTRTVNIIEPIFDYFLGGCVDQELGNPFYIPPSTNQLDSIITLNCRGYVNGNDGLAIRSINSISLLKNLEYLDLSNNGIEDISPLSELTQLNYLDLSENISIRDFSALSELTKLVTLKLEFTSLSNNTVALSPLINLESLDLTNTSIRNTDIEKLTDLINLKELTVYNNLIHDISPFSTLTNLIYLSIGFNCISDFTNLPSELITLVGDDMQYPESDFCIDNQ